MELVCCLLTKVFVALNKGKRNLDSSNLYNPVNHSLLRYLALNAVIYVELKLSSSSLERLSNMLHIDTMAASKNYSTCNSNV